MEFSKLKKLGSMSLLIGCVVAIDQVSKYIAYQLLDGKGVISLFNDCLRFLLAENRGGFLSLGASLPENVRSTIFLVFTSIFLFAFFLYTLFDKHVSKYSLLASSMILGGGIGNLIDRAMRQGAVIDFVNVGIGSLRTGIFNIADMAVLFGCILLFFSLKKNDDKASES